MPIYEFYCQDCHTVFSFLSRVPGVRTRPDCPRCGRPRLERLTSCFAVSRGRRDDAGHAGPAPPVDTTRLARTMSQIAHDVERAPDDDPRRMAAQMRNLLDGSGLSLGSDMDEALERLAAGEDPERIDEELGQGPADEDEPWIQTASGAARGTRSRPAAPPRVDDRLYEL